MRARTASVGKGLSGGSAAASRRGSFSPAAKSRAGSVPLQTDVSLADGLLLPPTSDTMSPRQPGIGPLLGAIMRHEAVPPTFGGRQLMVLNVYVVTAHIYFG